jgi:glycosyltransferase involved in cell wall biosynthesis
MDNLDGSVELILVNDGSKDNYLKLLRGLHQIDSRVCYISFVLIHYIGVYSNQTPRLRILLRS